MTSHFSEQTVQLPHQQRIAVFLETPLATERELLRGVSRLAREVGNWTVEPQERGSIEATVQHLQQWPVDGVLGRFANDMSIERLGVLGIPVVSMAPLRPDSTCRAVHEDDTAICRMAFEHLQDRAFTNLAYCGEWDTPWSRARHNIFCKLAESLSGQVAHLWLDSAVSASDSSSSLLDVIAQWLEKLPKPIGILASNDSVGVDILTACRRMNLRVPEQVAVMGIGNDELLCDVAEPPLSSVVPDYERIGYEAAKMLDELLRNRTPSRQSVSIHPSRIAVRGSTTGRAIEDPQMATAMSFIRKHACHGITIDDVVQHTGMARSTLQRHFRKTFHRTIHDEIVQVRLDRAVDLLANTELQIDEIAQKSGFLRREYLGVVFRREFGETPAVYRKRQHRLRRGKSNPGPHNGNGNGSGVPHGNGHNLDAGRRQSRNDQHQMAMD
ncbi:MAG: DNA-binding transcriptional regulator [Pirellulaceae bacterium]|nr:DNA-binding transcriptional regulator [Planctomycetales bacterium]